MSRDYKILTANLKRDLLLLAALLAAFAFLSCGRSKEPESPKPAESAPVLVRTMTIPAVSTVQTRSFPIFAKEAQSVKLSFRVPGQLLEFDPILGSPVQKDDILGKLDPRDYTLAADRLVKGIQEAEALLKAMKTGARAEDIAALQTQIQGAETAAANAARQLQRMENLRADGTASEVQYDLAKTANDAAAAHLETLKTQLNKALSGARAEEIEAMEAKIAGLNIDLELARNKLNDTVLKAPFSGTIAEKFCDNHEMVIPGQAVLELVDTSAMEATVNVPEEIVRLKNKISGFECRFQSIPETVYPAALKEIGQAVQRGNLAYPMTVRIDLAPEAEGGHKLLAGMVGTVTLTIEAEPNSIQVPASALIPNESEGAGNESAVWLYDAANGTLTRHPVRVGAFTREGATIVEGLSGGETIVSAGARFLSEGQPVRVE